MTVPWWNRMSRRGCVIEGVDFADFGATVAGWWRIGGNHIIDRVRMPGDPPAMTFTGTKVTSPEER